MKLVRCGCLAVALPLALAGLAVLSMTLPFAGFQDEVFVDVPMGTSSMGVARLLAGERVIRFEWQFLLARVLRPAARLQAGEYRFAKAASVWEIYSRIARGDVFFYELTVPEGHNIFDIAQSVEALRLMPAEQFLKAARDPEPVRDLDAGARNLEGYLFPATYHVTRHTNAEQICRQMTAQFRKVLKELRVPPATSVRDLVTLASLVEKETAIAADRPLVASVYANRLRIGMKLDCDPATIYAALLEGRYDGTIHRSDLDSSHPYNTYRHAGLPPGPIANPGRAALEAALHPAESDYLYFVAKPGGSGAHQFSREFGAHKAAVAKYRSGKR
jgi:UPF0755 protein